MTSAVRVLGGQFAKALRATVLLFVALPINVVTVPVGGFLFGLGSLLELAAPDAGGDLRMTGLETIQWGWDWWPLAVDIEFAD